MPIMKRMKGLPQDLVAAEGLMYQDWNSISHCQRECTARFGVLLQREQEEYMIMHPEILAMLKIFIAKMTQRSKRKDHAKEAALHFTRSFADLDEEIRTFLESPPDGPYVDMDCHERQELTSLNRRHPFTSMPHLSAIAQLNNILGNQTTRHNTTPPSGHFREHHKLKLHGNHHANSKLKNRFKTNFADVDFEQHLRKIIIKHFPAEPWDVRSPAPATIDTESSSFISIVTSDITLPTPEPIPTPELTTSEIFYNMISNTVDKVIFTQVDEPAILYDTAYVELMKAVEQAMEIPVIEIRQDIANLFKNAFRLFELNIAEKAKIAAAEAWEKRMRKKLKRSLRRQKNFKGYETPPSPSSTISTHESYLAPPPRPCKCQPLPHYNRYEKDRFGIYLPRKEVFSKNNVTTTPAISMGNLIEGEDKVDSRSILSKRSTTHSIASTSRTPHSRNRTITITTDNDSS